MKSSTSVTKTTESLPPKTWWHSAFSIPKRLRSKGRKDPKRLWIIAYDVADPRRLRKAARRCLDFGARQQGSLYECNLDPSAFNRLWKDLQKILQPEADSLVAYPIHASFIPKIQTYGIAKPPKLVRRLVF